ncbi:MAG: formylglycine-generating enzyme family protein [Lentimonas sp.]
MASALCLALAAPQIAVAQINLDAVFVANAGNADDSTGFGGVDYDYYVGAYEVTNAQYNAFLNAAAATDTYDLYDLNMGSHPQGGINRAGTSGSYTYGVKSGFENRPVNYVNFWDAARFTNWLTSGDTEDGVYVLTPTGIAENTITRDSAAWANGGIAVASEDEWYKAAYYDGNGGYTLFATQTDERITTSDANFASSGPVDVGNYPTSSHYGTFDQSGNLWETVDTIVNGNSRVLRGGGYDSSAPANLESTQSRIDTVTADFGNVNIGFRVASLQEFTQVPEPSADAAILGFLGLSLALVRRKR